MSRLAVLERKPRFARNVWLWALGLSLFYLFVGLALRYPVESPPVPLGGDEHHYMTQAESLRRDGDLVVVDNYEDGDYAAFYGGTLDPSLWNLMGSNGYSGHSAGTGVLVTPGWLIGGWFGVLVTLALAMGVTYGLSAMALTRLHGRTLPNAALALLLAGFVALPLLAYSHTLYPESFMATCLAGTLLLTIGHLSSSYRSRRTVMALAAISVAALSIALHPKYVPVVIGLTVFLVIFEIYDAVKGDASARVGAALFYVATAGFWLALFSWTHLVMWDAATPFGWWIEVSEGRRVEPGRALVQFTDLLIGREHGLFFLGSLTILSLAFAVAALRPGSDRSTRRLAILVLILTAVIVGLAAFSVDWHAGDSPLGRYGSPLVPILLLAGLAIALRQQPWTPSTRAFLAITAALGIIQGLAYSGIPLAFRPRAEGAGVLAIIADRVPGLSWLRAWFWSANGDASWLGLIVWVVAISVTIRLFARPDRRKSTPDESPSPAGVTSTVSRPFESLAVGDVDVDDRPSPGVNPQR